MSDETKKDFRKFLSTILGEANMVLVDEYAKGQGNGLTLAATIGSSYMRLVDGYVNAVKQ